MSNQSAGQAARCSHPALEMYPSNNPDLPGKARCHKCGVWLVDATAAIEQARREEREVCAKATCERCRITPHLPAFECHVHGEGRYPWWCHDSGVEGWGHYLCTAAAIRARAQEGT